MPLLPEVGLAFDLIYFLLYKVLHRCSSLMLAWLLASHSDSSYSTTMLALYRGVASVIPPTSELQLSRGQPVCCFCEYCREGTAAQII
ncbi:hypothetical protein EV126DRAFT_409475 [Verticillium dahliae]|nr:hypothetical protein EV126DRAFT_435613 [Verticillium dahliae]KAH6708615.1 hypothetical protein EV126DRAFT_409475 [Verticillium dahliae]